jgi:hypothetical protein
MVWYVALVAILNIGLGYALAIYLGAGRKGNRSQQVSDDPEQYESLSEADEYESADEYADSLVSK